MDQFKNAGQSIGYMQQVPSIGGLVETASKISDMDREMGVMSNALEVLAIQVEALEAKLSHVCRPESPNKTNDSIQAPLMIPLAQILRDKTQVIQHVNSKIISIIDRLEI